MKCLRQIINKFLRILIMELFMLTSIYNERNF